MAADKTTAYYSIFSRFWQLAAGVLLFYAVHRGGFAIQNERAKNIAALVAGWLGLLILGWVFFTAVPNRFPWPGALWTTVGALLLLGGWIHLQPGYRTYSMIANRPVQYTGRISYSLYLWHWPVFVIFRWSVGLDSAWKMAAAAAASVLLALVSYQWVEKPARKLVHQWRWPLWWRVVGALGWLPRPGGCRSKSMPSSPAFRCTPRPIAPWIGIPMAKTRIQMYQGVL